MMKFFVAMAEEEPDDAPAAMPPDSSITPSEEVFPMPWVADRWAALWDFGIARRRTSVLLWRGGLGWTAYREVRDYQAVVLSLIKDTLKDLEIPEPAYSFILDFYGEVDDGDFPLEEVHWAEAVVFHDEDFEEVD